MESSRYQRHSLIDWFSQEQISSLKICIIGAGAVGNEVVKNLALLGVGYVDVYDFDFVEIHNLTRSVLFREEDVGNRKSDLVAKRARELSPDLVINSHFGDFSKLLGPKAIKEYDVVFCCVDNFEARIKLNRLCYLTSTDLVNIGIDSRFSSVEIFPFREHPNAACYECSLPNSVYSRISQRYSCGWLKKISFIEKKIPTTIVTSSVAAGLATSLGLRLGKDFDESLDSSRVLIDTISGHSQRSLLAKKQLCPCCGIHPLPSKFLSAQPKINDRFCSTEQLDLAEVTVWTSEPIIVGYTDNSDENNPKYNEIFDLASNYTDNFANEISDNPDNIVFDIRDQFSLADLAQNFYDFIIPGCYAVIGNDDFSIVLDFGGKHCD